MAPQACNPRIRGPTQVDPEISPQVSQPSRKDQLPVHLETLFPEQ